VDAMAFCQKKIPTISSVIYDAKNKNNNLTVQTCQNNHSRNSTTIDVVKKNLQ